MEDEVEVEAEGLEEVEVECDLLSFLQSEV